MHEVESRMRAAMELRELMIAMRRQTLLRENPETTEEEIEKRLRRWVVDPPGQGSPTGRE